MQKQSLKRRLTARQQARRFERWCRRREARRREPGKPVRYAFAGLAVAPRTSTWDSPHQGARECARRRRQIATGRLQRAA